MYLVGSQASPLSLLGPDQTFEGHDQSPGVLLEKGHLRRMHPQFLDEVLDLGLRKEICNSH